MHFDEMKGAFETYIGAEEQVDNAQLALWLSEAQLDLAYELGTVYAEDLQVEAGEAFSPGADWLKVVCCTLPYVREPDGKLRFSQGGSGKLYYRKMPAMMTGTSSDQECELPLMLHYLPPIFAASRYWDMESEGDGEESNQASKWLGYYYQGKNMARARLDNAGWDVEGWQVQ